MPCGKLKSTPQASTRQDDQTWGRGQGQLLDTPPPNHLGPRGSYLQDSLEEQETVSLPDNSLVCWDWCLLGNLPEFLSYFAPWSRQAGAKDASPPKACRFFNCVLRT